MGENGGGCAKTDEKTITDSRGTEYSTDHVRGRFMCCVMLSRRRATEKWSGSKSSAIRAGRKRLRPIITGYYCNLLHCKRSMSRDIIKFIILNDGWQRLDINSINYGLR